ncbi:sugar ABC transporter ATP-binding protein [Rubrobacter naiadicus]|uniref:sugar ABC transporter ATP-binding protein n=1 Tax=Rubrobacter naiadicus TaxID=1392641 RepID=UPI00235DEA71|nr:sugar ABC transporter ATP-binding protein [Rubrobacter naiadicus]
MVIEASGISKSFGAVRALREASFSAKSGEVHGLVGENGAGKSTLIKILSGLIHPDKGEIRIKGRKVELNGPQEAQALGIRTVFQELTLMPWMTVAENLLIQQEPRGFARLIRRRELATRAAELLSSLGIENIDPLELVSNLPLAQQQIVEIARTATRGPEILFLDEPTSSLSDREVEWLFGLLDKMRREGKCIVFTSHRWREIDSLADRLTIFRDGKDVGTYSEIEEDHAITLMTGRRVETVYPTPPPRGDGKPTLEVRNLRGEQLRGLSFTLHEKEILGVGGLEGQGQRDLFLTIFGASEMSEGEILVDGESTRIRKPLDAIRAGLGIALVPEDRKSEGLLLPMTVRENLTLPILRMLSMGGVIKRKQEWQMTMQMVERLQIRLRDANQPVSTLSGGNQQKVLVGRWLLADSRILLFYDVTRGVDVATKHDIYELMLQLLSENRSILFYSSDTEEVAHLSHRVLVMREGKIAAELEGPGVDPEELVAASMKESTRA